MVRVQNKISVGLKVLQYYTTKNWIFKNDKLKSLREKLNPEDSKTFNFDMRDVDWTKYIQNYILGARHYLLKEKPETLPAARIFLRRYNKTATKSNIFFVNIFHSNFTFIGNTIWIVSLKDYFI